MSHCMILTTCADREKAEALALELVKARLAACVQLSAVTSFYTWKQTLYQEPEIRLVIKTRTRLYSDVERLIRERHDYEVPQIILVPIEGGSEAYLKWLDENTLET